MTQAPHDRPYKVIIVVDPAFGERLTELPADVPVWVIDTAVNGPVAGRLRGQRQGTHLTGITTFRGGRDSSAEDNLIDEFSTIDLHHGSYSASPPYTEIEIFGAPPSAKVQTMLCEYGFTDLQPTPDGFRGRRQRPTGSGAS